MPPSPISMQQHAPHRVSSVFRPCPVAIVFTGADRGNVASPPVMILRKRKIWQGCVADESRQRRRRGAPCGRGLANPRCHMLRACNHAAEGAMISAASSVARPSVRIDVCVCASIQLGSCLMVVIILLCRLPGPGKCNGTEIT
jgi:hypothetical protein